MSAFEYMMESGLASWETILHGWRKKFMNRNDLILFAMYQLEKCDLKNEVKVSQLAGGDDLPDDELEDLLLSYCEELGFLPTNKNDDKLSSDKWRFAYLVKLEQMELDLEEKLEKLQEIYSAFGYPEDMSLCSPYPQSDNYEGYVIGDQMQSPILAMKNLIIRLREKLIK